MTQAATISLIHQKGGVGKSTVAVNLAAEFSKLYKTLLIDCDPMKNSLDFGNARNQILGEVNSLNVCHKSFTMRDGTEMNGRAIRQDLKNFKSDYEVIIIDTPGVSGVVSKAVASVSDLVIVPMVPGVFDVWALGESLKALDELMTINENLIVKILMNRRDDRTSLSKEAIDYLKKVNMTQMNTTLGSRTIYGKSAAGLSVVEIDHLSEAASEISTLVGEIEKTLNLGGTRNGKK